MGKLLKNPSGQILISWQTNSCSVLGFQSGKLRSLSGETVTVCIRLCVCKQEAFEEPGFWSWFGEGSA